LYTPLVFVLGKGGVGKTSASCALAKQAALLGKRSLIVQWSLSDSVASFLNHQNSAMNFLESVASTLLHDSQKYIKETQVESGIFTVNFSFQETVREYFVDHLGQKLLYSLVIENKHVQKLLQASPGVQELFFLGRLFWLIELAEKERGWKYDHVFVDTPSTGHGVSLFGAARSIAKFGMAGPLGEECRRVQELLDNPKRTSYVVVTLPEELPLQETRELISKIEAEVKYAPAQIFLNKHVSVQFCNQFVSLGKKVEEFSERSQNVFKVLEESFALANVLSESFQKERSENIVLVPDAAILQQPVINCWLNAFELNAKTELNLKEGNKL
jgi:anion-transporting  ArsA/GET3 family ATPase